MELEFSHYGEERSFDATEEELELFEELQGMTLYKRLPAILELTAKSSSYLSAAVGEWDLARFKYTDRAKWIIIPLAEPKAKKHKISSVDDVHDFDDLIDVAVQRIKDGWDE